MPSSSCSVPATSLPQVLAAPEGQTHLSGWLESNRPTLDLVLRRCGAALLRGFSVNRAEFARFADELLAGAQPYLYRSTPRTAVGAGTHVYTATEYPPQLTIPLHCENAYQRSWPTRLLFWCEVPAATGGETPLADMLNVTSRIPTEVVDEFAKRKVLYVRNYSAAVDLPWQTVFQTNDRSAVEHYCQSADIAWEWKRGGGLRTRQICQGVAQHPSLDNVIWFNQAHLFHVSSLDENTRNDLLTIYREDELPRHAYFGDGKAIDPAMLDVVRAAFAAERTTFGWRARDVLVVDNMRVAHGRNPYTGDRRVLVAMGVPHQA